MPRTDGNLARADVVDDFAFGEAATTLEVVVGQLASVRQILDSGREEDAPGVPLATARILVFVALGAAAVGAAVSVPTAWVVSRLLGAG